MMHKLVSIVFVAFLMFGCSHVPTMRQSALSTSHPSRVRDQIVQSGNGSMWLSLFPPQPPNGGSPNSITPGPDGKMWFTLSSGQLNSSVVGNVDMSGTFVEYPVSGYPIQITTGSDGAVWFTETPFIGRITTSGVLTEFRIKSRRTYPYGIALGADGNIWFTDRGTTSIGKITPKGVITEYNLNGPDAVEITGGSDGNLWFVLPQANQIGRITPRGHFAFFGIPSSEATPEDIALGSDGHLYFTEWRTGKIGEITRTGKITEYALPGTEYEPLGITQGISGNSMWYDNSDVRTHNSGLGQFLIRSKRFLPPDVPPSANQPLQYLHYGPDGNIWVPDASGSILILLTRVLTSNPASVEISGVGQNQTVQIHETLNKGGAYTAVSSDQSIATAGPVNQANLFVVTAQGVGSCTIRVSDSIGNYIDVPVTVQ
jgi:virginiamycin B lyase